MNEFHIFELNHHLNLFESVSLNDMEQSFLMRRFDRKFMFHNSKLPKLLNELQSEYLILDINGTRIQKYRTVYFDTENFSMYMDHHNQKSNRFKIRKRTYLNTDTSFYEIKFKNNKNITTKKRISCNLNEENETGFPHEFIKRFSPYEHYHICNRLTTTFNRMTFTDKSRTQRFTIDIDISYNINEFEKKLDKLVIAELKQIRYSNSALVFQVLKKLEIHSCRFSKYCIGTALMNPSIKFNNFKEQIMHIQAIGKK